MASIMQASLVCGGEAPGEGEGGGSDGGEGAEGGGGEAGGAEWLEGLVLLSREV